MKKLYPLGVIFLIFLVGTGFILYPSIGNFVTLNTASVAISDYEEQVEKMEDPDAAERFKTARAFNEHLYHGTNTEGEDRCLNADGEVICYLDIPQIDVYLPVYYGVTDEILKKGCGYILNTSLPVGGENSNSAISGHTGLPGAELLSRLSELEEGDEFYIHVLGEILAYRVDQIKTVLPDHSEDLAITPGKDYVTLVTCTPYGINSHRLLVRGGRVAYTPEEEEALKEQTAVQKGLSRAERRQLLIIIGIVAAAAITVLAAYLYNRRVKKHEA